MSDPSIWTPPCSPKFIGGSIRTFDDLDADLFQEQESESELFDFCGISCDSFSGTEIFEFYTNFAGTRSTDDLAECINCLWSRMLAFSSTDFHVTNTFSQHSRNDVTVILSIIFGLAQNLQYDENQLVSLLECLRICVIHMGMLRSTPGSSHNVIHLQIELWVTVMKLLESVIQHRVELIPIVNPVFGLAAMSVPNAFGYLMDVLFEILLYFHCVTLEYPCRGVNNLWSLVIRYFEKFQSGWFKYLHGKMSKLATQRKLNPFEPRSLESLRPDVGSIFSSNKPDDATQITSVCSAYWSVLVHSAPLHRTYMNFTVGKEVLPEQLQKYSIVVWLIRRHLLGDIVPCEQELRSSLQALLRLGQVWGPNMEVIRTLWLYFNRRLDQGLVPIGSGTGSSGSLVSENRFSDWLRKLHMTDQTQMNSFELFCLLLRAVPWNEIQDLKSIIKISLPSLTRHAVRHYFQLLGHLFDEVLSQSPVDNTVRCQSCTELIDLLWTGLANSELRDWDVGRRCATLQNVQHLIVLFKHHLVTDCSSPWVMPENQEFTTCFLRLVTFVKSIRESLSSLWLGDSDSSATAGRSRLSALGWRAELIQSGVQFGLDLLQVPTGCSTAGIALQQWIVAACMDQTFFQSLCWLDHGDWIALVKPIVAFLNHDPRDSESILAIRDFVWQAIFPRFNERVRRQPEKSAALSRSSLGELASCAVEFVNLASENVQFASKMNYRAPQPLDMVEYFSLDAAVDYSFRFTFVETWFSTHHSLAITLASLVTTATDAEDIGWRFLIIWLAYGLLIHPCSEDRVQERATATFTSTPTIGSQLCGCFPPEIAALFSETDPELSLINIAVKYDNLTTFHSRMAYKATVGRHLTQLCTFLCDCCSVTSAGKEDRVGLNCCRVPGVTVETLCCAGYRAVALLVRHCSPLLYSPGVVSPLEQLVDSFILPRQLYEWEKLQRALLGQHQTTPLPDIVCECMKDTLSEVITGFAQLSWRSDAYISRVVRDTLRLYYTRLGPECTASAILNSPTVELREHLIQLAAREAFSESVIPGDARSQLADHLQKRLATKWISFCKCIREGTCSIEQWQRDKVHLIEPIRLALNDPGNKNWITNELKLEFQALITEAAVNNQRKPADN